MKVREIMSTDIKKVDFNATLSQASEEMMSSDVGFLPVENAGKAAGIITDRDIVVRAIARHLNPEKTPVSKIMTSDITSCYDDEDIEEAAQKLEEKQIHRLLVLNRDEEPVGILSLSDLAVKASNHELACRALEKICEPVGSRW